MQRMWGLCLEQKPKKEKRKNTHQRLVTSSNKADIALSEKPTDRCVGECCPLGDVWLSGWSVEWECVHRWLWVTETARTVYTRAIHVRPGVGLIIQLTLALLCAFLFVCLFVLMRPRLVTECKMPSGLFVLFVFVFVLSFSLWSYLQATADQQNHA